MTASVTQLFPATKIYHKPALRTKLRMFTAKTFPKSASTRMTGSPQSIGTFTTPVFTKQWKNACWAKATPSVGPWVKKSKVSGACYSSWLILHWNFHSLFSVSMVLVVNNVNLGDNGCILKAGNNFLCLMKIHDTEFYCGLDNAFRLWFLGDWKPVCWPSPPRFHYPSGPLSNPFHL